MSSHREAPEISKDPAADNTDVYAWVDPTDPTMVNLVANFNPFEIPYGGPNFSEFDDDVLYTINVSNKGTSKADISYQFRFKTTIRNPKTFLYNTGPITSITDTAWNRPQTFSVTKLTRGTDGKVISTVLGTNLLVPPCNVGQRSTPDYDATYRADAVQSLGRGEELRVSLRQPGRVQVAPQPAGDDGTGPAAQLGVPRAGHGRERGVGHGRGSSGMAWCVMATRGRWTTSPCRCQAPFRVPARRWATLPRNWRRSAAPVPARPAVGRCGTPGATAPSAPPATVPSAPQA